MASFSDLRPRARSAKAGSVAVRALRSPKLLAVSAALLLTALFAVSELATLRGAKAHDTAAPLTRELGSPLSSASLVRMPTRVSPAVGGKLEIRLGGLRVRSGDDSLSLRFGDTSPWRQFANGVARPTAFGREAIMFGVNRVEESLLVDRHVGVHAWTWKLGSNLDARVARNGSVRFGSSPLSILPVAILDAKGRDVTPAGARWSVQKHALVLRLDDGKLPTPYIIDPVALVGACGPGTGDFAGCSVHNVSNKNTFTSSPALRPSSAATGDLMIAAVTIRNNDPIAAPAGWTTIGNMRTSGAGLEQRLYYRIATAADTPTTTYSWSWTNNADASVALMDYSGVDGSVPFDVTPSDNAGTGTTATASSLTTTQDGDMLVAFYGAQGNVTETQNAGESLTQEYTAVSGSGPASRVRDTGADGTQNTAGATGNKTAAVGSSTPWVAHLAALTPLLAADGSGTMGASIGSVSASQPGRAITFTYTAAAGGMINGTLTLVVPSGWSAPSTTGANAGYTTASAGTVAAAGQTITVSGLTVAGGSTVSITYGSTAGGGPGATATSSTGAQTWQAQEKSKSGGTLTNLASSPSITVYAADGSGTIGASINNVSASQTGRTIAFTYTAPAGGISGGSVTVAVPAGWSAPSTTPSANGYSTAGAGTLTVAGQTITVSSLTLAAGNTLTISYGNTSGGGSGATATSSTGAQTWQAQERSTANGSLTNLAGGSPAVTVYAADGSGGMAASISAVSAGQTGRTITFTYTAAAGGISNGTVTLAAPAGWSAPSLTGSAAGYTTASSGTVSVSGQTITVSSLTVGGGSTFTVTYGSTASGGPGATATSSTGAQTWTTQEKSTSAGTLTSIAASPSITVYAADGAGTLSSGTSSVPLSSTGNTLTFTYTAPAGASSNGSVTLAVPSGWSAPSTTGSAAGYSTSSAGTLTVAGGTITVSSLTLTAGTTMTITYGATGSGGPGATAPSAPGAQTWQAQAKSTSAGSLANLGSSPSITVLSGDGSGTLTTGTGAVNTSSTGNTITFTYTAAAGGLANGSVTLAVPGGWSAPSTTGSAAGYTTASAGSVSVAGQTVTVSGLTLSGGSTLTLTYGSTAGGGGGATSPGTAASQTWQAQEKSSSAGTLTNLASSPAINVNDTTAPAPPSLSFGSFTNASVTGSTVYIRQGTAGGFTVTGTSSDPESGIDHLTFPSGLGTGWSGGGQDATSPYTGAYAFTAASTAPGGNQNVTATNGWALTSAATAFTIVADTTAPSVSAPTVTGGYFTSLSVPVTKNGGTDGGSGVDGTSSILERDDATLTNGACGSFSGSWTPVTLSGGNDTSVLGGHCYEYRERLSDNVGNQGTSAASTIAKMDNSAPSTPSLAFSGLSANAYYDGAGTLYIRPAAGGTFTVTAAASDAQSGVAAYSFGTLNSNGGANFGGSPSGDHVSYTFDGTTTAPGTARTVSAANGAGTSSADATYSIAADTAAPAVSAPSVAAGYFTSLSVPVTKNGGTDSGAGIDPSSSILERDEAPLANGTCGSFSGSWTTVTLSGGNDSSVLGGRCYEYRERLSDRVGNQGTSSPSNVAKVDTQAPANSISLSSVSPAGSALKAGSRVYYRGAAPGGGSLKLTNAVTDSDSGPASSATAALGGTTSGWSHTPSTVSTPAGGPFDSNTFSWSQGTSSAPTEVVTATDAAGNTTASPALTFTDDSAAPTGGALVVNGGAAWSTSGSFPIDTRTDYSEPQSATESGLASSTLTRAAASLTNNTCGSYGSPTTIAGAPAQTLPTGCYLYTLTGTDNVGNSVSVSQTVKVDASAPTAPTFGFSNFNGPTSAAGDTVFFLPTSSGSFDVTASSSDGDSGIAGYSFPSAASFGSGWTVSGSGATRTYSYTPGSATPGAQTVTASNNAGLPASSAFSVIVSDTTPPTTTIRCNGAACQAGYYASAPVSVTLSADDGPQGSGVDVIRYTLDGSDPTPLNGSDYVGPIDIIATTTVKFRAYDNLGNEEAVGSQLVRVDATAPTGQTIALTGAGQPYYTSSAVTFTTGNGADADSGLDLSSAKVTRETGDLAGDSCSNFTADAGTFTSPDTSVTGGHCYRYSFTIADNAGHVSTPVAVTAKVDLDNPSVTLADPGSPVAGTVSLSATASDASTGVQQVVFQRSPAGAGTWTTIGTDTTAPYAAGWDTTAAGDGLYDLRAVATDTVGHTQSSVVAGRRADNTAPQTTIDSGPADPSNDTTPSFAFSSSESGSSFQCRVDGGSWAACTSPFTTSPLAEGAHTFDVRATDQAGNTDATPASSTWTVDLTAPDTSLSSTPSDPSNNTTPAFTFGATEPGSTFECRVDGGGWSTCSSPFTTATLGDGSHTFDVRATDAAGNTDATPASYTWSIDSRPPSVAITAPTTYINASDPSTYTVTASTPDGDVTHVDFYECSNASAACSTGTWTQFDSDNTAPYTGSWTTPGADGTRAIRAVAVDAASNTGADVRTITIDRTPPSGATVTYPNGYVPGAFAVTTSNGPDADVDASTATLERETGTLAGDTCSSYSGWTAASSPDTVASGHCAVYRFRIADHAGNWTTVTSPDEVKSDTAAPTSAQDDPGANLRQTVTLASSAGDTGGSGVASVAFERRPAGGGSWTTIGTDTSSPYSVSFDTTTAGDGLYDFRTVATDVAGNTETSPSVVANRRIDNTAPSATMLSPGNPVRGTLTLASTTSDVGSGLASVTYELAPHGGGFTTQPASWDTTLGADGLYDLRVVATDVAGNSTTSPLVTTRVDNTPPALTFSSPAAGATVSGTVALTATASDASPATPPISFFYKLHTDPPSAYTPTPASWDTTSLAAGDGLYDLRAIATDDAANTTTVDNASVLVDNVPPVVAITTPAPAINGSLPSPTSLSAAASDTGSGVQHVQFFECSNQSTDCSTGVWSPVGTVGAPGPYTVPWNIPGTDGNYALAAVATDNAGHSSSDIRNVSVDRTAPDTTITGEPGDPSNAATPSFTFGSNEAGSTFECRLDGGSWAPCTSPDSLSGLSDNTHTFDVRATDPAGNTDASPASWTWHRDTTSPAGTLSDPGANIRQTVTLTSSENDPPANGYSSGLASVTYEYSSDGTTWATIGTLSSAPFTSLGWDTTGVADGVYELRIVMHDVAGNSAPSAAVTNVRIDNTPPTASQDDPGQYLRGIKTLTGSAADSGSGVDHVDFELAPAGSGSWTTVGTDTTAPFSTDFDTVTVADGHYDFRMVAYDAAGNQAASTPVSDRLVDNTPPSATLNDPGAYLRGAVGLSSGTSDPGGANASGVVSVAYEYSTNGGATWLPTGSTFDSTSVADGNVQLHVVATDAAGNTTTSAPLTKLVDNTKPNTTDDAPGGWHSSPVTVHLTGSDAGSGVNVTEYSVDGNPTYTVGTSVVIPAPADGSNDGAHTIAYFSVDNAGNIETVKSATVLIDATPPACSSCSAADYLRGTVTLSASPAADSSGIKSVAFEYSPSGAGTWTTIATDTTGPAPYPAPWDTTAVPDGHYDLRIVITDNADNVTTSNLPDKVVDNTSPNVATVGAPTEGQLVTGTVTISASASDATSPIASVEFFVRGTAAATDTTAPFSFDWNTTGGPDGAATIRIVVTDMAGNTTTSAVRNVTVDNVAPTPTLADPGQNLSGTVSLSASSDADTTQVDFERRPAGGGSWVTIASDSSPPWGTSLDTTTLADGLYDFRAVATDGTGHVGTSPIRSNVRVDNTAPTGSLTAPAGGATVGGQNVTLSASVSDGGSGVATVGYELRPTGGGAYTRIASSSSSPFSATWDATTVSTGSYDLRPVITDRAGNTFTGAAVTFNVDVTAPTVTLTNPGATISGTVTLHATVSGSGATSVVFAATPTGGATWTTLGTDTTSPWGVSYDTTKLADGVYDLRATVTDSLGNTAQDVVNGVRIDNIAPRVVSSTPADGSTVSAATAISLVTSESATPVGVTLDGGATVAPVVSGTHIDYNTGALAAGSHVLAGEVQDASGKRGTFRIHFTVGSGAVEKNTSPSSSTTVTSSDGFASATMPSGAWSGSGNDWLVLKIATTAAPTGLTNGFGPGPEALDVTAYWALSGVQVHEFAQPVELVIHSTDTSLVPATFENGAWRVIHQVPTPGVLPAGWTDGFWRAGDGVHILTRHLSLFALLRDLEAPQAPQNVRGYLGPDGLTIRWLPGSDNSGTYDYVTVFAGSTDTGHYGPDYTAATLAGWHPGDPRIFRLQETDLAGNRSELTPPLVELPSLTGLTVDEASAALAKLGLTIGSVTVGGTGIAGTITGPEGLVLAPQGGAVDVTVAPGGASGLVFKVVTAPKFKPAKRKRFAARVVLTRPATVTTQLYSPRRVRLYTWHFKLRAGGTILRLRLPRKVRRPGIYSLRWTARTDSETATRTVTFRLIRRRAPAQKVQIVLAGTAAQIVGSSIGKQVAKLVMSVDPTFDAAANRNRDVRVVVVDADELGVATVRDLHIVFPSTKIVALAAGPKTMAAALRAGATVALPRSTPPATLARIVRRLAARR